MKHLWKTLVLLLLLSSVGIAQENFGDLDADGYPDAAEFHSTTERASFMSWFAAIAEAQYTQIAPDWKAEDQDCAGLLRYAFVEALKPKNLEWFAKYPSLDGRKILPLSRYPLPNIVRSVFRVSPGRYQRSDVEQGRLVGRTSAMYLMRFSTVFLGRTPDKARRGDLLFFVHPLAQGSAYHSMVYLGDGQVVYHTGYAPSEGGEVRLVSLATLNKHPIKLWHPKANNPNFLGFYRWKIVENNNEP